MMVESMVLASAIIMVFPKDSRRAVLLHSFMYQSNVNPFQLRYGLVFVALNEFVTMTKIGRNRKRYTALQNAMLIPLFLFSFLFLFIGTSHTPRLSISPPSF